MTNTLALEELDFFDPVTAKQPFLFYELARQTAPVYKLPNSPIPNRDVFLVSSYDLVIKAALDTGNFSNQFSELMGSPVVDPEVQEIARQGYPPRNTMLTQDLPEHRAYKTIAKKAFNAKRVSGMTDYIRSTCDDLIDQFQDRGQCDFFEDFAVHLPLRIVADQLGVPRDDVPKFRTWTDHIIVNLSQLGSKEDAVNAARSVIEFQNYFVEVIENRREHPQDDVISDLVNSDLNDERKLDVPELLSIIQQILVAGNETTRNALAGGMLHIIGSPGTEARIRDNPDTIPNMVEEILRLEAGTKHMWRIVKNDTEFAGVQMKAGDALLLSYDGANRDPEKFECPHEFDITRENASTHLSFGKGIHFCVGAPVARQEMIIAYQQLFSRLANWELAPDMTTPDYLPSVLHRGLTGLRLSFNRL